MSLSKSSSNIKNDEPVIKNDESVIIDQEQCKRLQQKVKEIKLKILLSSLCDHIPGKNDRNFKYPQELLKNLDELDTIVSTELSKN